MGPRERERSSYRQGHVPRKKKLGRGSLWTWDKTHLLISFVERETVGWEKACAAREWQQRGPDM